MEHVMTIKAFERKIELGGGFRGIVVNLATREKYESGILPTHEDAKFYAQKTAHDLMAGKPYRRCSIARRFCGNRYIANIWA